MVIDYEVKLHVLQVHCTFSLTKDEIKIYFQSDGMCNERFFTGAHWIFTYFRVFYQANYKSF